MKILIVEDEAEIRELIKFTLEFDFEESDIYLASDGVEAINILEQHPDIELVLCDYTMPRKTGGDVFEYIQQKALSSKFVLCSAYDVKNLEKIIPDKLFHVIEKPDITTGIEEVLKLLTSTSKKVGPSEYMAINLQLLELIRICPADIFILKSQDKYEKLFSKGDMFSKWGQQNFYIKRVQHLGALQNIQEHINIFFNEAVEDSLERNLTKINEIVFLSVKDFGFKKELITLVEKNVEVALKIIGSNEVISKKIRQAFKGKGNYISLHSSLLCIINAAIASKLDWGSGVTVSKLVFASLVHDLDLDEARIVEYELMQSGDKNIEQHGETFAAKLKEMKNIPPDVERIILEHHELPGGTGFPHSKKHLSLSPLSSLFIFSHRFVDILIENKENGTQILTSEIAALMKQEGFEVGLFEKFFSAINKISFFHA